MLLIFLWIIGAICAERAALVQLRKFRNPIIRKVVVVTVSVLISNQYLRSQYTYTLIYTYIFLYWYTHVGF
jgi:hypothetical protein